jgi:hypothetical protein
MAQQISDPTLITLDIEPTGALRGARDRHLQSQDPIISWYGRKSEACESSAADIWNGGK